MSDASIHLVFDVAGGGDITGESGALILRQLTEIMGKINSKPLGIKVQLDPSSDLHKQVADLLSKVGTGKNVSIKFSTDGADVVQRKSEKVLSGISQIGSSAEKAKDNVQGLFGAVSGNDVVKNAENIQRVIENISVAAKSSEQELNNQLQMQDLLGKTEQRRIEEREKSARASAIAINKNLEDEYNASVQIQDKISQTVSARRKRELSEAEAQSRAINKNLEDEWALEQKSISALQQKQGELQKYVDRMQDVAPLTGSYSDRVNGISEQFNEISVAIDKLSKSGSAASSEIETLRSRLSAIEPSIKSTANVALQLSEFKSQITAIRKEIDSFSSNSLIDGKQIAPIREQATELLALISRLNEAKSNPNASEFLSEDVRNNITNELERLQKLVDTISVFGSESYSSAQATSEWAAEMGTLLSVAEKLESVYKSTLSGKGKLPIEDVQNYTAQYVELQKAVEDASDADINEIQNIREKCIALQQEITERQKSVISINQQTASTERANKAWNNTGRDAAIKRTNNLLNDLTKKHNTWTAAAVGGTKQYYETLGSCVKKLSDLKTALANNTITQEEYNKEFGKISLAAGEAALNIVQAGKNVEGLGSRLGNLSSKFASWLSVSQIIMYAVRSVRQMVTTVVELDSAMTQLQIVTGASDIKMREFLQEATVLAKELGRSITEILSSIETFSRLGYNLEDASELAKYANIMANVASVDTSEATTGLTSIIKGFNLDVSEAEHVADVLVEVGQKYAVSAAEMIEAYEKSGAALNATNTSFEKSAGLIAAANAAVQNASTVGKYCAQCHSNVA